MKKFKINVQGHGCILLCLILCVILLPVSVSAQEDRSKVVRVGWYEGIYNTTGSDGQRRGAFIKTVCRTDKSSGKKQIDIFRKIV
jgi:hypothetical protein